MEGGSFELWGLGGPDAGRRFALREGTTSLGSGGGTDVDLRDATLRSRQVLVHVTGAAVRLEDAGGGPTVVDGTPVATGEAVDLRPFQVVELGDEQLVLLRIPAEETEQALREEAGEEVAAVRRLAAEDFERAVAAAATIERPYARLVAGTLLVRVALDRREPQQAWHLVDGLLFDLSTVGDPYLAARASSALLAAAQGGGLLPDQRQRLQRTVFDLLISSQMRSMRDRPQPLSPPAAVPPQEPPPSRFRPPASAPRSGPPVYSQPPPASAPVPAAPRSAPAPPAPPAAPAPPPASAAPRASSPPPDISHGAVVFNPPSAMKQGEWQRVEVAVSRSPELVGALTAALRGTGHPEVESISTSSVMEVQLVGEAFEVTALSPAQQLVEPSTVWEYDVRATRHGRQRLILRIAMYVPGPLGAPALVAVPVLERLIQVRVALPYSMRRFTAANWQWIIATALGLGGAISAWLALLH